MQYNWNLSYILFLIFPYISLSILFLGSLYRWYTNPLSWDSKSSELLSKDPYMFSGAYLFHYGIVIALIGHVLGMMVPQWCWQHIGITETVHMTIALYSGMVVGWSSVVGLVLLTGRRLLKRRVLLTSDISDIIILLLLLIVAGLGTYNVTFVRWENVLHDIAPWLRSIFILAPNPDLIAPVPLTYKAHFVAVWTLFAFYPFSRLVHITSAPVWYLYRVWILFRKR